MNSEQTAANQHCQTLWKPDPRPKPLTVYCRRGASEPLLDEKCLKPQCQKMVSGTDLTRPDHPLPQSPASLVPAARIAPELCLEPSAQRGRAGMPGAQCTRSLVCAGVVKNAHESQRSHRKSSGIPARNGFNGFLRDLPGDRLFCHRHRQRPSCQLDASVEASGPHDFSVRMSAVRQKRRRVHRIRSQRS